MPPPPRSQISLPSIVFSAQPIQEAQSDAARVADAAVEEIAARGHT